MNSHLLQVIMADVNTMSATENVDECALHEAMYKDK